MPDHGVGCTALEGTGVTRALALVALLLLGGVALAAEENPRTSLILVVGAGGEADYDEAFSRWAAKWQKAAAAGDVQVTTIGLDAEGAKSLEQFRSALEKEPAASSAPLWIVLLGHGTWGMRDARFNLRGDDLPASEYAKQLQRFQRPLILINAFSSSGAFLAPLTGPNRVVVTATKAGGESNYSRFGQFLAEAIVDPAADLDHDGQTSVLEAWLSAAQRVADFYKSEGRIATEHSLLDDNGDGRGTPSDWFRGLQVVKKPAKTGEPDGLRARQIHLVPSEAERNFPAALRQERDTLELELARLRETKPTMPEAKYYQELEALLLRLAELYQDAEPGAARSVPAEGTTG